MKKIRCNFQIVLTIPRIQIGRPYLTTTHVIVEHYNNPKTCHVFLWSLEERHTGLEKHEGIIHFRGELYS